MVRGGVVTRALVVGACFLRGAKVANSRIMRIENAFSQLKMGDTFESIAGIDLPSPSSTHSFENQGDKDFGFIKLNSHDLTYFAYFTFPGSFTSHDSCRHRPFQCVEVFRCPRFQPDYVARTKRGRDEVRWSNEVAKSHAELAAIGFEFDFIDFATGGRRDLQKAPYQLIYSDPPAKPAAK